VIVLEDLHWADEATLDVLRLLGRRMDAVPAMVVATYRADELDGSCPLRVVLGELARAGGATRLEVPRLSRDAVAELARAGGIDADALHRVTDGNPFFVTEVVGGGTTEVPSTVRDAVLARTWRLSAPGAGAAGGDHDRAAGHGSRRARGDRGRLPRIARGMH